MTVRPMKIFYALDRQKEAHEAKIFITRAGKNPASSMYHSIFAFESSGVRTSSAVPATRSDIFHGFS